MSKSTDRILDLIDNGLQRSAEASYGDDEFPDRCVRCQANERPDDGDMCDGCRAFLLEDSDDDPAAWYEGGGWMTDLVEALSNSDLRVVTLMPRQHGRSGLQRLVEDSMPVVTAPRGGIRYFPAPRPDEVDEGLGLWPERFDQVESVSIRSSGPVDLPLFEFFREYLSNMVTPPDTTPTVAVSPWQVNQCAANYEVTVDQARTMISDLAEGYGFVVEFPVIEGRSATAIFLDDPIRDASEVYGEARRLDPLPDEWPGEDYNEPCSNGE